VVNPLKKFSDEDLLEELCRRQRVRVERDERLAFRPCDDCANFIYWDKEGDPPGDYNACKKGHEMKFRMPEGGGDPKPSEYGFYRRVCADRTPRDTDNG
jgi:hypothetical protein